MGPKCSHTCLYENVREAVLQAEEKATWSWGRDWGPTARAQEGQQLPGETRIRSPLKDERSPASPLIAAQ